MPKLDFFLLDGITVLVLIDDPIVFIIRLACGPSIFVIILYSGDMIFNWPIKEIRSEQE